MSKGTTNQKKAKVLVIPGQQGLDNDILRALGDFDVKAADSIDQAHKLLKKGQFDAVLCLAMDFVPVEQAVVSEQAVAILQTLGEGVCIVSPDGTVLWANPKMEEYLPVIQEVVSDRCLQAFETFNAQIIAGSHNLRPSRYSFVKEGADRYFEMIVTAMRDHQGELTQVAAVVWEESAGRRLQKRIDVIDKAGRELVRLEADSFVGLTVEQRINVLQNKIISYAKDILKFDHFVVRVLNNKTRQLEVLFGVGLPGDEEKEVFANIDNNGITGYVAVTGRSYICNDTSADRRYLCGLDAAASSLTIPLRLHDKIIGTLNVESAQKCAFSEDDRQVAEIFGRYVAIALNILNLLVVERYQTTGVAADTLQKQLNDPVSHIITEASMLMEGCPCQGDMRDRLQAIIDNASKIKDAVRGVQNAPKGIIDSTIAPEQQDKELSGKKILIVDDEQFIRETIIDVVERYDCVTDMARDGREAIALLKQHHYDLVISDIKLPHATGYDIFAQARMADKNIPVILMTGFGYDPNHSIVRANKEGLSAVLYKPFKVDQLINEIRKAIVADDSAGD